MKMNEMFKVDKKKPVHRRDVLVALVIGFALLIMGAFVDLNFSKSVYDPVNTSWFGIIFAGIAELPVCIGLISGGVLLFLSRLRKDKENKEKIDILFYIIAVIAVLAGYYFLFDTLKDIDMFKNLEDKKTLIMILALAFALVFGTAVLFGTFLLSKHSTVEAMFKVGFFLIIICAGTALVGNIFKYLWCRPRPRFIVTNDWEGFHPLWQLSPLACFNKSLTGGESNNLKSFPSGHSMYAGTGLFVFPLLTMLFPKTENNRKLQVGLFYGALLWTIICMVSRVYAGAHFLSDTAAGLLTSILVGTVVYAIMFEKQISEDDPANA